MKFDLKDSIDFNVIISSGELFHSLMLLGFCVAEIAVSVNLCDYLMDKVIKIAHLV